MKKKLKSLYFLTVSLLYMTHSSSAQAWDSFENSCACACELWDISAELRVAYYQPASHKVRRIYGSGWADYQLEISKGIGCGWRAWAGISGLSKNGNSIGFHDSTKLQLIPLYMGLKYDYTLCNNFQVFFGGAACYSFLNIRDRSDYVHAHIKKGAWGGVVQLGAKYHLADWAYVSLFADYFFQEFSFHSTNKSSYSGPVYYYENSHIGRSTLDMNGYKVGVGIGLSF